MIPVECTDACRGDRLFVLIRCCDERLQAVLTRNIAHLDVDIHCPGNGVVQILVSESVDPDLFLQTLMELLDGLEKTEGKGMEVLETRFVNPQAVGNEAVSCGGFRLISENSAKINPDDILLNCGLAFGTGSHPSTRLAAEMMGMIHDFPPRVLDVGCGSGILSIISVRCGARDVLGVDICPQSIALARKNVTINDMERLIRINATPLDQLNGRFDLVLANLANSVLFRLFDEILRLLNPQGTVIFSGLQGRQARELKTMTAAKGLKVLETLADGKWQALQMGRV